MDDKQFLLALGLAINNKKVTKFINICWAFQNNL